MDIYHALKALGVECSNHESDLYAPATPEVRSAIKLFHTHPENVGSFASAIDGQPMVDIPFAFAPWWEHRTGKYSPEPVYGRTQEACEVAAQLWKDRNRVNIEITESVYDDLLGAVPPYDNTGSEFYCGEPYSSDANGRPVYYHCWRFRFGDSERFFMRIDPRR